MTLDELKKLREWGIDLTHPNIYSIDANTGEQQPIPLSKWNLEQEDAEKFNLELDNQINFNPNVAKRQQSSNFNSNQLGQIQNAPKLDMQAIQDSQTTDAFKAWSIDPEAMPMPGDPSAAPTSDAVEAAQAAEASESDGARSLQDLLVAQNEANGAMGDITGERLTAKSKYSQKKSSQIMAEARQRFTGDQAHDDRVLNSAFIQMIGAKNG